MRAIHVTTRYHASGGAERNIAGWIREEIALGWDVAVVAGHLDHHFLPKGVKGIELASLRREINPREDVQALLEMRRLFRAERPDLVHTHESKAGILGRLAAVRSGSTVVHSVHIPSFDAREHGMARALAFRALEIVTARATDHIVTVSDELRQMYVDAGVGPTEYTVIHSPIDIDGFLALRDEPKMDRAAHTIGMIGALEPRKRHAVAIRTLAPLLRDSQLRLVIAGDGVERARLEQLVLDERLSGHVELLGYTSAIDLLRSVSMLVHTSRSEGLAQVIVQAAAAGIPIVATPMPGLAVFRTAVKVVDLAVLPQAIHAARSQALDVLPAPFFDRWRETVISEQRRQFLARIASR